jgi:PEGA domain
MKQRLVSTLAMAVIFTGAAAAAGQDRSSNGNTTGTAVSRGGDGGGASSSGSSGSSGSSSGSSSSGNTAGVPMGGGFDSPSIPSAVATSFEAPQRSGGQRSRSSAGGTSTGDRAVSRDSGSRGGSTASTGSIDRASSGDAPSRRAVPEYSRPREGRPVTGTAVERGTVPPPSGGGGNIIIYPSYPYYPWGFWGPGYSYGLGYLFYDPWYGGGYGYGDPYGWGGYGGGGYSGGGGGYQVSRDYKETGGLRLKIDPKQAQVYVDGYYAGVVDSFDGSFQKLSLEGGGHKITLKADGFEPIDFEVLITPGETVTYKGEMKRIQ